MQKGWHGKRANGFGASAEREAWRKSTVVEREGNTRSEPEGSVHPRDKKLSGRLHR